MQNERMGEMEMNAEWIAETDWKKSFNFIAHLVAAFIFMNAFKCNEYTKMRVRHWIDSMNAWKKWMNERQSKKWLGCRDKESKVVKCAIDWRRKMH